MRTIQDIKLIPIRDYLAKRGITPKQENSRYGFYLSPLREEQDASFKVDYTQNLWYDFGAGRGGSIIDLVMEVEKCNFQQAVERLRNDNISTSTLVTSQTLQTLQNRAGIKRLSVKPPSTCELSRQPIYRHFYCQEILSRGTLLGWRAQLLRHRLSQRLWRLGTALRKIQRV